MLQFIITSVIVSIWADKRTQNIKRLQRWEASGY
nr:MAG TPA: hypothetical protein [Caudoviricetes sp.]